MTKVAYFIIHDFLGEVPIAFILNQNGKIIAFLFDLNRSKIEDISGLLKFHFVSKEDKEEIKKNLNSIELLPAKFKRRALINNIQKLMK
jgi:hypothetical protein